MSAVAFHRRRAERFARLLDEANGLRRRHAHSSMDEELSGLVPIGQRLAALSPAVKIEPDFRTALRAMLVAAAERERAGSTRGAIGTGNAGRTLSERRSSTVSRGPVRTILGTPHGRARGAIVVGIAVGAVAISGISAASEDAKPGDALYRVKRSTERAQLALASSDVTRGQLHLDFARARRVEAQTVGGGRAGFIALFGDMDADTRQGVKLLATSAVYRRDPAVLNAIDAFVRDQRPKISRLLDQLTGADRERALASLRLLDAVHKRSQALRGTLGCRSHGNDQLGPIPGNCVGSGSLPTATSPAGRTPMGTSPAPAAPGSSHPPGTPDTSPPTQTVSGTAAIAPATPADEPDAEDTGEGGLLGDLGRILGDLLG